MPHFHCGRGRGCQTIAARRFGARLEEEAQHSGTTLTQFETRIINTSQHQLLVTAHSDVPTGWPAGSEN